MKKFENFCRALDNLAQGARYEPPYDTVVLTGSVTTLSQAKPNFENFQRLYGIRYIIPERATFATAIGAGLRSLERKHD